MKTTTSRTTWAAGLFLALALVTCAPVTLGQTYQVLYTFQGSDGANPDSALVLGSDGNFYGTAHWGGDLSQGEYYGTGLGTIFKMTPDGTLTTLVMFEGTNGALPEAALVQANDGNF